MDSIVRFVGVVDNPDEVQFYFDSRPRIVLNGGIDAIPLPEALCEGAFIEYALLKT